MRLLRAAFVITSLWVFLLSVSARSEEALPDHPFLGFLGQYEVVWLDCLKDGGPGSDCDLAFVEVRQDAPGRVVIVETGPYGSMRYPLSEGEYDDGEKYENATIAGSPGEASWKKLRRFLDGSETETLKLLVWEGERLYYHAYHRLRGASGDETVTKATYWIRQKEPAVE